MKKNIVWFIMFMFLIIGLITALLNYNIVDLHFSIIRNPLLFYISAISTTCGLMVLGTKVNNMIINYLGRNSLIIMFCQLVQQYICQFVNKILKLENECKLGLTGVVSFATIIFVLFVGYIVSKEINKNSVLHLLVAPKNRKKI